MIFSRLKKTMLNCYDKLLIKRRRKCEINKFKDPRRVEIFSKIELSNGQKEAIDELYLNNYGEKISYAWHRHFTAYTGNFDKNYFPELLFIPEFEHFMNFDKQYCNVFADKNVLPMIAKALNIKTPKSIISAVNGNFRDNETQLIAKEDAITILNNVGEVFIKPSVDTGSGKGCFVANFANGTDLLSNKNVDKILDSLGDDFVIQERVKCHSSISNIYSQSVNTFRIMTYIWKNEIVVAPIIMRIGQGGACVDNAHAGGMFIAIDKDGTLHETAFTEFKDQYTVHPNSKVIFKDYKVENFSKVIESAKRLHSAICQIGCVNWDFTIDESGNPVLIEANILGGSIWLFQMAHGCSVFGDKTPEILRWIRLMKKTKASERNKFSFGKDNK